MEDSAKHGFDDLVVRRKGEVSLTDSFSNQVFRFDPGAQRFALLPAHRALSAPNGIALADDDRQLFVADDLGVVRVDLEKDRKSTRLNSSHQIISYAVFCLKKKKLHTRPDHTHIPTAAT